VVTSGDIWKKRSSGTNLPPCRNASSAKATYKAVDLGVFTGEESHDDSPSARNSGSFVQNSWLQRESLSKSKFGEKSNDETEDQASNACSNAGSTASSYVGSQQSRGGVLGRWNKRGQDSHSNTEFPSQSPSARRNDQSPSIADKGSPAFGDVWAK
jgi:hypothetical protein